MQLWVYFEKLKCGCFNVAFNVEDSSYDTRSESISEQQKKCVNVSCNNDGCENIDRKLFSSRYSGVQKINILDNLFNNKNAMAKFCQNLLEVN